MSKTKSKKKKVKSDKTKSSHTELPTWAQFYPISRWQADVSNCKNGNPTFTICLMTETILTANGSGIITSVFNDNPTAVNNWANYSGAFDSYRVLGFKVTYSGFQMTGGTTQTYCAPIATVIDRSDSTALASYLAAAQFSSCVEHSGGKKWSVLSVMLSTEDASFLSTAAPSARGWIKLYSTGNTISLSVGRVLTEYLVQFRQTGVN